MRCRQCCKICNFAFLIIALKQIGLISDTHGYLDEAVFGHFRNCDEIWHAGDFGSIELAQRLALHRGQARDGQIAMKGVYGNIDGQDIRSEFPEQFVFMCEEVKAMMRHIGGSPPNYNLFISGHSHILKIIYDDKIKCLHINPGAAGNHGWHKIRTIVRFVIDGKNMRDCEVIELGKRGL